MFFGARADAVGTKTQLVVILYFLAKEEKLEYHLRVTMPEASSYPAREHFSYP